MAYFELAKNVAGITEEEHRTDVLKQLTGNVHPLALGNVQRVYMLIRRLAKRLLALHLDSPDEVLESMVEGLTTDFYTHMHSIARSEAIELLGDWILAPEGDTQLGLESLFGAYSEMSGLGPSTAFRKSWLMRPRWTPASRAAFLKPRMRPTSSKHVS